jgi:GntR family transcriptional regulator
MSLRDTVEMRPLYLQVRDVLVERVATGVWKAGGVIPNEIEIAREFGVSVGTVRKALGTLEAERLVVRRQGRGTFVADQTSADLAVRFSNIYSPDGQRTTGTIERASANTSIANATECRRLRLSPTDSVIRVARTRALEGRVFMTERVALPQNRFARLNPESEFSHRISVLARDHGIILGHADERVAAVGASKDVAADLRIAEGVPVLELDRVVFTIDGDPVEWRMAWCHLDAGFYMTSMR